MPAVETMSLNAAAAGFGGFPRARRPNDPNSRHFRLALMSLLIVWLGVFLTQRSLPTDFVSRATLILPAGTPAVSVSIESIGQASTAPAPAYNTGSISPKVIYKEMAQSEGVRAEAARTLRMSLGEFGMPRIRFVDETALIHIEFRNQTADGAQSRAQTLVDTLQLHLDRLRQDELDRRSAVVNANLKAYQDAVAAARTKIAAVQEESGLVSMGQFNELSSTLVQRKRRLSELRAELEKFENEQRVLRDRIGITPEEAASALTLAADPTMTKFLGEFATVRMTLEAERRRLGPASPTLIQLEKRWAALKSQIETVVERAGGGVAIRYELLVNLANESHQAELFKRLVANEAAIVGRRSEFAVLGVDTQALDDQLRNLTRAAARLEDLKKDHLVAEAVLTTAMARLNTSKSDIYASYPLVQVLSPASMPAPSGGNGAMLAFIGGIAGTILISVGWFLAWMRHVYVHKRLKSI